MPQVSEHYLETRKNKIAKAAVAVFAKKGYSNATMKDIMEEVQISRGGLYAHFENIDSVFLAALQYDDSLSENQFLVPDTHTPLIQQFKNWLAQTGMTIDNTETNLIRAKSEYFLLHDASDTPYLQERHERLVANICSFISLGISTGEFKEQIDARAFADLLIAIIDGIMLHQYSRFSPEMTSTNMINILNDMMEKTLLKG